ncbi:MAG TPA: histidinol-phosphate transaminase [Roseiflexaceae bacterium]|nr:histidinol-phosphate transaminase [Roseiflexaceae bacterium]
MASIASLLRPDIAALKPYTPILPFEVLAERLGIPAERLVKLDANENPYGPSPRALEALAALSGPAAVAIYPDPGHTELRRALSGYTGQPERRIICGAGADELIDLLMRAVLAPGDAVVNCPPTFGMYAFDAGLYAARVVDVPRDEGYELDGEGIAEAAEQSRAKMLFVTAPNNPTGTMPSRREIERLLELPLLVVVDEAYIEFAGGSVADLVGDTPNLVVLRTFSKWAGLAGLRVGYGLVHEELIEHLWKIKQPYNVNVAAQAAALASLADVGYLRANVDRIVAERARLFEALSALPWLRVYPSQANFLLCRVRGGAEQALRIRQELERRGILIRYYSTPELRDCIRVSVGTPAQSDALLEALEAIGG